MDLMSNFDNIDVMNGNENNNPMEKEFANTTERSTNHYDPESNSHLRENSSQQNEGFGHEKYDSQTGQVP